MAVSSAAGSIVSHSVRFSESGPTGIVLPSTVSETWPAWRETWTRCQDASASVDPE